MFSMQNSDGGWAAFDKDHDGKSWIYSEIFKLIGIDKSAEVFGNLF